MAWLVADGRPVKRLAVCLNCLWDAGLWVGGVQGIPEWNIPTDLLWKQQEVNNPLRTAEDVWKFSLRVLTPPFLK